MMGKKRRYQIIGACSGWGAQLRACEKGPEKLAEELVFERLKNQGIFLQTVEMLYPETGAEEGNSPSSDRVISMIHAINLKLASTVKKSVEKGDFPVILGGDHSIATGTWNAFDVPFGLLWIDAHMDSHTPQTTPSGALHGMPVAALLGHGMDEMAHLIKKQPVINPQNLALIGVRSFEKEEKALLEKLNVKIYYMDEVRERGLKTIFPEAIAHITKGVSHYGVSLDLDAFCIEDAPGVGSPEPFGISKRELLPWVHLFRRDERLIGFEIVEFNPERDVANRTSELVFEVLYEVMKND